MSILPVPGRGRARAPSTENVSSPRDRRTIDPDMRLPLFSTTMSAAVAVALAAHRSNGRSARCIFTRRVSAGPSAAAYVVSRMGRIGPGANVSPALASDIERVIRATKELTHGEGAHSRDGRHDCGP